MKCPNDSRSIQGEEWIISVLLELMDCKRRMGICWLKSSFSFHKITKTTLKSLLYILVCHCISLSLWFIILDKNNIVTLLITIKSQYEPLCISMLKWRCARESISWLHPWDKSVYIRRRYQYIWEANVCMCVCCSSVHMRLFMWWLMLSK